MDFIRTKTALIALGERLRKLDEDRFDALCETAISKNAWFTKANIRLAIEGLCQYLDESKFNSWIERYEVSTKTPKRVGIVMAGNIPMVGIHDLICVLISGHKLVAKLSSQDDVLIPFIIEEFKAIDPELSEQVVFVDQMKDIDAVIATGSNNTARYFDYYFGKYPNIIRKNRTSVAILSGDETKEELELLGTDMFSYFGLGCRNVSKLYLTKESNIEELVGHFSGFSDLIHHNKYHNNYYYNKSILLANQTPFVDTDFALFTENEQLASPISMTYFEYYDDIQMLKEQLSTFNESIQCKVTNIKEMDDAVSFGKAQRPDISDYADNVDTMEFLLRI